MIYTLKGTIEITVDEDGSPIFKAVYADPGDISDLVGNAVSLEISGILGDRMSTIANRVVREMKRKSS